jgi:AbrB family looped-hinge helix DNA binding protein
MADRTTIGAKSQTVVPRQIREHLGIGAGDQLDWKPGPNRTAIVYGRLSVPTNLLTTELVQKLEEREHAMDEGEGVRIKDIRELRRTTRKP